MKKNLKKLWHYPVVVLFFLLIFGYMFLDILTPDKAKDEYQNALLAQKPVFTLSSLLKNEYTVNYETYIKEQFAFRHEWIVLKSLIEEAQGKTENNGVVYGADGYQFNKFVRIEKEEQLENNTQALMAFSQRHPGKVSAMIVPSASLVLKDKLPAGAPFVDEGAYLDKLYGQLAPSCTVYDLRALFSAHQEEYLYYRTDHHWTTHGAYLAYTQLIAENGKTPVDEPSLTATDVPDFYGTNYSKSLRPFTQTDVITYYPPLDAEMTWYLPGGDGVYAPAKVTGLYDLSKLQERDKYAMFLYSNNAFSRIAGRGEGRILIIKDSYANCFVPFLTENYAQIDVIDLRSYNGNIDELIDENRYDSILALYNFQSFCSDTFLYRLNTGVS
ncbi:MAG: DHHW family protein [Oscillospiraceae bacterium]|nr:DHHW family protein [Oscillospiraceae bacterium]